MKRVTMLGGGSVCVLELFAFYGLYMMAILKPLETDIQKIVPSKVL